MQMQSPSSLEGRNLSPLFAISPVDGRYCSKTEPYALYFSEFALIRYRVRVEVEYFIALCKLPLEQLKGVSSEVFPLLRGIYSAFSEADAQRIKTIEQTTNHDVKAVEYFLKEKFDLLGLQEFKEFIHFGLTSQDINNTSVPLSIKEALENVFYPEAERVIAVLQKMADDWKDIPMLAKTHGQPASPTRLGKEIEVFVYRLEEQIKLLKSVPVSAKFGGATGNLNAHRVAYPQYDWKAFGNRFVNESLGLQREQWTTQISNYDNLAALFDGVKRFNTILTDLCRDVWTYVSMEYFKQRIKAGEVGSSAMPHKVNPIDFENAEGNLGMANAVLEHLAAKLPVSRLQRDLTDSTVLRNVGIPFAHSLIATQSILKGLGKLLLNEDALHRDLEHNWAVVAEGIQTILRREGYPSPYEALKALTRTNEAITEKSIKAFIETLEVSEAVKAELRAITPFNYTGI
jgi:adenylosuccinate lyase